MREIYKKIVLNVDGTERTFRLKKLDAFSGAQLLQLMRKYLPGAEREAEKENGKVRVADLVEPVFMALSPGELKELMMTALGHTEVQLEAGYQKIMEMGEWGWPELEHDAGSCLRITLESVLWSLEGFFGGAGSRSRPEENM